MQPDNKRSMEYFDPLHKNSEQKNYKYNLNIFIRLNMSIILYCIPNFNLLFIKVIDYEKDDLEIL